MTDLSGLTDQELIEAVATKVMGWHPERHMHGAQLWKDEVGRACAIKRGEYDSGDEAWDPLTDWNHTMEVLEKAVAEGCTFKMQIGFTTPGHRRFDSVEWYNGHVGGLVNDWDTRRAICLAALAVVSS